MNSPDRLRAGLLAAGSEVFAAVAYGAIPGGGKYLRSAREKRYILSGAGYKLSMRIQTA
jgi:hypothetical protein